MWCLIQDCDQSQLLQTHVNGLLFHGHCTYAIVDIHQWDHDSNLTINCLLACLFEEAVVKGNKLPRKLYVQLDNCARENKNRYYIGILALLVKLGVVEEVLMSILMVGHTHEGKLVLALAFYLPTMPSSMQWMIKQSICPCLVGGGVIVNNCGSFLNRIIATGLKSYRDIYITTIHFEKFSGTAGFWINLELW